MSKPGLCLDAKKSSERSMEWVQRCFNRETGISDAANPSGLALNVRTEVKHVARRLFDYG
jgi:hypothetical protein